MRQVWVVEIKGNKLWSEVAVALSRADACLERCKWEANNPHDKFRVAKSSPADLKPPSIEKVEGLEDAILKNGEMLPGVSPRAGMVLIDTKRIATLNEAAVRKTRGSL